MCFRVGVPREELLSGSSNVRSRNSGNSTKVRGTHSGSTHGLGNLPSPTVQAYAFGSPFARRNGQKCHRAAKRIDVVMSA